MVNLTEEQQIELLKINGVGSLDQINRRIQQRKTSETIVKGGIIASYPSLNEEKIKNAFSGLYHGFLILEMEKCNTPNDEKTRLKNELSRISEWYFQFEQSTRDLPLSDKTGNLLKNRGEFEHLKLGLIGLINDIKQQPIFEEVKKFLPQINIYDNYNPIFEAISNGFIKKFKVLEYDINYLRVTRKTNDDPIVIKKSDTFEKRVFMTPIATRLGENYKNVKIKTKKLVYIDRELHSIGEGLSLLGTNPEFSDLKPKYQIDFESVKSLGELEFQCRNLLEGIKDFSYKCKKPGEISLNYDYLRRAELMGAEYFPICTVCPYMSQELYIHKQPSQITYCEKLFPMVELTRHTKNILDSLNEWMYGKHKEEDWEPPFVRVKVKGKFTHMKFETYRKKMENGELE